MTHLLVTNDFPPKVGGIQSYLWELWRRLPAGEATVLTTAHPGATAWDAEQPFDVHRVRARALVPTRRLADRIDGLARAIGADLVLLDPAWPLGLLARHLRTPYGVVLHGAEVTVPARLPVLRRALRRTVAGSRVVVAAGRYPAAEGVRVAGVPLPVLLVPPGVDPDRFHPRAEAERAAVRRHLGVGADDEVVVSVSRLVPRKGMDVLVRAAARLAPERPRLRVVVGGGGRDQARLERLVARLGAPVRFVGPVPDGELPDLYAAADVFAMLCRDRWGGLEQEGFGIVFLEAAAAGVAQVAGRSGGSHEAVEHGVTGLVVDRPRDDRAVAAALGSLLGDGPARRAMGAAARRRAVEEAGYDRLAARLAAGLAAV